MRSDELEKLIEETATALEIPKPKKTFTVKPRDGVVYMIKPYSDGTYPLADLIHYRREIKPAWCPGCEIEKKEQK